MANVQIGSKPDVLYVLTISGDLADYYDGERGEGAFDALTPDQQYNLAKRVSVAIESGCQESIAVAFEFGLEDFDDSQNWPKLIYRPYAGRMQGRKVGK